MSKTKNSDAAIVVTLPSGWARAALAGVESVILAWIVPTATVIAGFWTVASNPWFHEETWESAGQIGGNFWALSLFSPAHLGAVSMALWPLGWTIVQLCLLRLLLLQIRGYAPTAAWAAVPTFVITSIIVALFGTSASWWRVGLGALAVSLIAAAWSYLSNPTVRARLIRALRWVWYPVVSGTVGVAVVVVLAGVLVLITWIANWSSFLAATKLIEVRGFSAFLLNLTQIMFYPVLAGCAWAWVVGAGFVGPSGTIIGPSSPPPEGLPVPVWAIIPNGHGPSLVWLAVVSGLIFGVIFAWLNRKRTLLRVLARFSVAAAVFLILITLWMWISEGSLGSNLLSDLGPQPLSVLWRTSLEVVLPAFLVVVVIHRETFDYVQAVTTKTYRKCKEKLAQRTMKAKATNFDNTGREQEDAGGVEE